MAKTGGTDITITAPDGFSLAATVFEPERNPIYITIISAAMATPRRLYEVYARYLSRAGHFVVTYDYRGTGGSRPESLKGFPARMREWAEYDMSGVIAWACAQCSPCPLILIGHSFGGQAAGLLETTTNVSAMVTISSQSGYWGLHPGMEKYRVWFFAHFGFWLLSSAYGYLPWSRFTRGEDLPKPAALEWARWSRSPDYLCGDRTLESRENFARFTAPILAYSFSDDIWGSERSVDAMMSCYTKAPLERRHVTPEDIGIDKIGHIGFFMPSARALWRDVDRWLTEKTG
ncbi:MAG: alpha/beta fold hydrolase [Anaerolineae bacterium]|nr:alpha/beta fold hydrolase [Anaerolineae bacterium]